MATCDCVLARPANLFGLGVLHTSLCMKHAETRFCMPTGGPLANAFLVRAESKGQPASMERDTARQEAAVSSTQYTQMPPKSVAMQPPLHTMKSLNLRWDMQHRLSE